LQGCFRKWFQDGIRKATEELAQKLSSEIDDRALVCTVGSLKGNDKWEQVPTNLNIPAVCNPEALVAPLDAFKTPNDEKMEALAELIEISSSAKAGCGVFSYYLADLPTCYPRKQRWTPSDDSQLQGPKR
jgi:hypothetical protein